MKEAVYGWYPGAKPRWQTTNQSRPTYDKECLYRHWNSRYNDKSGVNTPQDPLQLEVRGTSPFGLPARDTQAPGYGGSRDSRSSSRAATNRNKPRTLGATPKRAWDLTNPDSEIYELPAAPVLADPAPQIPRPYHITYGCRPPSAASSHSSAASHRSLASVSSHHSNASRGSYRSQGSVGSHKGARLLGRAQSADVLRAAPEALPRPVRSAGARNSSITLPRATEENMQGGDTEGEEPQVEDVACLEDVEQASEDGSEEGESDLYPMKQYEDTLRQYGWRAEVPGDPFNLKRPCLPPRLSYVTKVPEPSIPAAPPKAHMVNFDTFFSNTIPRKPLSFTIHKEWISEVLHAKRMDFQKAQGGLPYKHTNYSFMY